MLMIIPCSIMNLLTYKQYPAWYAEAVRVAVITSAIVVARNNLSWGGHSSCRRWHSWPLTGRCKPPSRAGFWAEKKLEQFLLKMHFWGILGYCPPLPRCGYARDGSQHNESARDKYDRLVRVFVLQCEMWTQRRLLHSAYISLPQFISNVNNTVLIQAHISHLFLSTLASRPCLPRKVFVYYYPWDDHGQTYPITSCHIHVHVLSTRNT